MRMKMRNYKYKNQIYDFMTVLSNESVGEIWIHGDITDDAWYDTDVTPKRIRDALDDMGSVPALNIRINSYGGSVIAGNAIINILDSYKRKNGIQIHAYIDGIAASMGSGIAMVADRIYMASNALFMIHKPYSAAVGNADDFAHEQEVLEKVEDTLVNNYMRHFNGNETELRQMMADETWLTAEEALEYGFCDEIIEAVAVAASAKGIRINGTEFMTAADIMKDKFKESKEETTVFDYDNSLMNYGITQEIFDSLNVPADVVETIASSAIEDYIEKIPADVGQMVDVEVVELFMTAEQAQNALGEEMDADSILALAQQGKLYDAEAGRKAKAYDNLVKDAMDKAIASGFKAKGDDFKESKWRKILSSLDYDEIVDQMHEWDAEAKIAVKAGVRVAEPWEQNEKSNNFNENDYKF